MKHALIDGNACAQGKNQNSDDKAPEVNFAAKSKRVVAVWRGLGAMNGIKQQRRIAGVDKRMNGFAQHGGTAGEQRSCELGGRNEEVSGNGGVDDILGGQSSYRATGHDVCSFRAWRLQALLPRLPSLSTKGCRFCKAPGASRPPHLKLTGIFRGCADSHRLARFRQSQAAAA